MSEMSQSNTKSKDAIQDATIIIASPSAAMTPTSENEEQVYQDKEWRHWNVLYFEQALIGWLCYFIIQCFFIRFDFVVLWYFSHLFVWIQFVLFSVFGFLMIHYMVTTMNNVSSRYHIWGWKTYTLQLSILHIILTVVYYLIGFFMMFFLIGCVSS